MKTKVSIGIPVYNEDKNIGRLLKNLFETKFDFYLKEIIIVCSGCTDDSVNIVNGWSKKRKSIRLIIEKKREGKSSAMNKILRYSRGDFILFIDGDTFPEKNSINVLIRRFDNPQVGVVTGRLLPIQTKRTLPGYFQNMIYDMHHELSFYFPKMGKMWAIRRGLVKKIPRKIINDDVYIPMKISKKYKILYEPRAKHLMLDELNLREYVKQRRRIAQGYMQLRKMGFNVHTPPILLLASLFKVFRNEPKRLSHMLLAILIEIYCNILALYDIRQGRIDYKWEKLG